MTQILLIQEAFVLQYTKTESLSATSLRLSQLMVHIFAIGIPTQDMFLCIVMLNALTGEFANVCNHVATTMLTSTDVAGANTFKSEMIWAHLDLEQQLNNNDTSQSAIAPIAHAPIHQNRHSDKRCSNMKCPSPAGHTIEECWGLGGGMEGKRDEVLAARKARWDAKSSTKSRKGTGSKTSSGVCHDQSGCAYLLNATGHAIYLATPTTTPTTEKAPTEFARLATEQIPDDWLACNVGVEMSEYETYITIESSFEASIDWRERRRDNVDIAALSVAAPINISHTSLPINASPFFLDTGATTHISPEHTDFFELKPLPPRPIKGIGGSIIHAIGIGSIKICIAKGNHIMLKNVLYVPHATVCLISIKSLCASANLVASFDATSCWLPK